ncbi:MAG: hypothetical protein Q7R41_06445, partial [Phycisphaerales bacterium]|nr:hypothetical protein [Phycisphaerales bacterium]
MIVRVGPSPRGGIASALGLPEGVRPPMLCLMSDRLTKLLRQRDLLREHQAWLDEEIKVAADQSGATPLPTTMRSPSSPPAKLPPPAEPDIYRQPVQPPAVDLRPSVPVFGQPASPDADSILRQYRPSPGSMQSEL